MAKSRAWENLASRIVNEMLTLAHSTKEFLREQVPDVLRQLILFKAIEYAAQAFARLVFLVAIVASGLWAVHTIIEQGAYWPVGRVRRHLLGCVGNICRAWTVATGAARRGGASRAEDIPHRVPDRVGAEDRP
jgi:hypothetical protein